MIRTIFLFLLILFTPHIVTAQSTINIKMDVSIINVPIFGRDAYFNWKGAEIEYEYEFNKDKLFIFSGLAIGVRREEENYYDGTYIFVRTYKHLLETDSWQINFSNSIVYGYPGIVLNRSWQNITSDGGSDGYLAVFPVKAFNTPGSQGIKRMGIIYPITSLSVQKNLPLHLSIEPTLDFRLIKFGLLRSGYFGSDYQEKLIIGPSFGLRLGLHF
jgi:hypothetical protein